MREQGTTDLWRGYQRSRTPEQKVFKIPNHQMTFLRPELGQCLRHPFLEGRQLRDRIRMHLWFLQFALAYNLLLSNGKA